MKFALGLMLQFLFVLATAWPVAWAAGLVILVKRKCWSRLTWSAILAVPYIVSVGAYLALSVGGHNGPSEATVHAVGLGSSLGVVVVWILLVGLAFSGAQIKQEPA